MGVDWATRRREIGTSSARSPAHAGMSYRRLEGWAASSGRAPTRTTLAPSSSARLWEEVKDGVHPGRLGAAIDT